MRGLVFAGRCTKEIVRDPISIFFGIAFPIILPMILTVISHNVPVDIFNIEQLLTNLTAFLSGAWIDLSLIGGAFQKIAYALPFVHAVDLVRAIVAEDVSAMFPHLYVVVVYAAVFFSLSIFIFKYKNFQI